MKILVGLSGGVDSSVTALRLIEENHEVQGALMTLYNDEKYDFKGGNKRGSCFGAGCDQKKIIEARRVSDKIGIKLNVIDVSSDYEKTVLDNFRSEYLDGKTPNPCIWCNTLIKFGSFIESARRAGLVFDKFATGHYARIEKIGDRYALKRAVDIEKDQTYFLYRLTQKQLSTILFPMGNFYKSETKEFAKKYNLGFDDKKESQDFYSGDYSDLLQTDFMKGEIVNTKNEVLGYHTGVFNYTIGQRKGLGVSSERPLYVISLDARNNRVIVGHREETFKESIDIFNIVYGKLEKIEDGMSVLIKIRSNAGLKKAKVKNIKGGLRIFFDEPLTGVTPGQSLVMYDDDYVIAGGIMMA